MEQRSVVRDVVIEFEGDPRKATYFVEVEIIHVMIDGRSYMLDAGTGDPESTVKAVLLAHCLQAPRSGQRT